ncbi:hypothetical protein WLQ65_17620 [Pseudoalteromonas piscicida]|uniref:hypothetical protein n=1 Tax=Pseudoalteromonas piscicida TaxID=43662 RepID=UPI0030C8F0B9
MFNIILLAALMFTSNLVIASQKENPFPSASCSNKVNIRVVDVVYCVDSTTLSKINFLGLSNQTAVVTSQDQSELAIALNPPEISLGDMHKKLNMSVNEFFHALYHSDPKVKNIAKLRSAFDIDENNPMSVYQNGDTFAFVVMGENQDYDRVYINKKGSDVIYQISGEFNQSQLNRILSSLILDL